MDGGKEKGVLLDAVNPISELLILLEDICDEFTRSEHF